jgi:hypothetical protein
MLCRECKHREEHAKAGFVCHRCFFTGAQVAEFACFESSEDCPERDDPNRAMCPLTLDRILDSREGAFLAEGVLKQVAQRGLLTALIASYRGLRRQAVAEFAAQVV